MVLVVVGPALKRRAGGEIGARKVYLQQYSERGSRAHEGVYSGILAFFTTVTASAMHSSKWISKNGRFPSLGFSSLFTNTATPGPGYRSG